jgi:hypothetical protein
MLSVAWPVALGPSSSSLAPAQQQQEQHAKLNPLFSSSSAGGGAAAGTTGSLSTNAAVEEEEFATSAVPSSAAAKIHAARLEDALLLEVACNILEQVYLPFSIPFFACLLLFLSLEDSRRP